MESQHCESTPAVSLAVPELGDVVYATRRCSLVRRAGEADVAGNDAEVVVCTDELQELIAANPDRTTAYEERWITTDSHLEK